MGIKKPISISDVLFSGVQQRVLGLLFGQPERSFYTNEIAKLGKTGRGSLQRELERMTAAGLVTMTQIGRQKHYQANRDSFVFNEIRSITLKSFGLADVLSKALSSCGAAIRYAFIFGSVARGTDTAASDIDVMVVGDGLSYGDLYEALTAAEQTLGRKVSPTLYSAQELKKRVRDDNSFVTRVLDQPKIWLIGGEDDIPAGKSAKPAQHRQAQI